MRIANMFWFGYSTARSAFYRASRLVKSIMLSSSEVIVLAGFSISVIAAAAAALVIDSPKIKSILLVGIVVVAASAMVLYLRAQRTSDREFREQVAREVNRQMGHEQSFQQRVDQEVENRLKNRRSEETKVDSTAAWQIAQRDEEKRRQDLADYQNRLRRDSIRAADEEKRANAARDADELQRAVEAYRTKLVGRWRFMNVFGCPTYMTFSANGEYRRWTKRSLYCGALNAPEGYSTYEVVNREQIRVSGSSGTKLLRVRLESDDVLMDCGPDLGAGNQMLGCLGIRFKKVVDD